MIPNSKEYGKYTVLRRISNNPESLANIISTSSWVLGEGYTGLIVEIGTYGASGVLWGYSWRVMGIRAMEVVLVWWIVEVGCIMRMGRNVRVDICSHVGL